MLQRFIFANLLGRYLSALRGFSQRYEPGKKTIAMGVKSNKRLRARDLRRKGFSVDG
jgi:hypothetical protein